MNEMDCQELVELVTAHVEGALDTADEERFVAHLADCPGCTTYLAQIRRTIDELGHLPPERLTEPARGDLLRAFRSWPSSPGPAAPHPAG